MTRLEGTKSTSDVPSAYHLSNTAGLMIKGLSGFVVHKCATIEDL